MASTFLKKIYLTLIVTFLVTVIQVNGQPTDPNEGGGGAGDPGGPQSGAVPVDGGLAFLLVAGAGYGAKKAYDYRKNKVKSEK
jgi:hypothetical protein